MQALRRHRASSSRLLVHRVHHAPPSLQGAAAAPLVDSGPDDLPRAFRPGVADLSDTALLPFREQDDAGRQTEHQPGRGLQRRQRQFLRHPDSADAERGSAAQRRSARALDPSGNAAGAGRDHGRAKAAHLDFRVATPSARTPEYTQAYLNAVMQKYLDFKKGMREDQGHNVTTAITEQLIQIEKDLRNGEDEMLEFQKQNNIGFIQEEGNSAAAYLVRLNQQYAALKTEYDLLESA